MTTVTSKSRKRKRYDSFEFGDEKENYGLGLGGELLAGNLKEKRHKAALAKLQEAIALLENWVQSWLGLGQLLSYVIKCIDICSKFIVYYETAVGPREEDICVDYHCEISSKLVTEKKQRWLSCKAIITSYKHP